MVEDGPVAADGTRELTPPSTAHPALVHHHARMRRLRFIYLAVVATVLAVVAGFVGYVWSHSEVTHAHLRTTASAPPSVALQTPAAALAQAWRAPERAALGTPYFGGTVVTSSEHSVSGRDALTGQVIWSYTRTDRVLCQAVQVAGKTIAIYRHDGNCDEVSAFETGTGRRAWSRTLSDNGTPDTQVSQSAVLLTTPEQVHSINPIDGIDHWVYLPVAGCTIERAVLGTNGVLIREFCDGAPKLVFRDLNAGTEDKKAVKFTLASGLLPASADQLTAAYDPAEQSLQVYDQQTGKTTATVPLPGAPRQATSMERIGVGGTELLWLGGTLFAVDAASPATLLWAASTPELPVVTSTVEPASSLSLSRLTVAASGGVVELDSNTGRAGTPVTAAVPEGGAAYPFGTGYLITGTSTAYYR